MTDRSPIKRIWFHSITSPATASSVAATRVDSATRDNGCRRSRCGPPHLGLIDDAGAVVDTALSPQNRKNRMRKSLGATASIVCAVLCSCATFAQAGPCSEDIAQFEAAIRQSAGNPNAGLSAPQSVGAQLEHQPTQQSVRRAQSHLRANFRAAMARAKLLDSRGDRAGCSRALSAAKAMYVF
jgi:hypothetical protein